MIVGDFLINLAASLAYSLLEHIYKVRLSNPQRDALELVYARAFESMLQGTRNYLTIEQLQEIGDVLTAFIRETGTADAYLSMALTNEAPNIEKLNQDFLSFGGSTKLRGTGFDFERGMLFFYQGLLNALTEEASKFESPLSNFVVVQQNRAVLQALKQLHHLQDPIDTPPAEPVIGSVELAPSRNTIAYFSCFLSYAHQDQDFVDRLYADLNSSGVSCWFAPTDMPIGGRIRQSIDNAIHGFDKLAVVLSRHSINSSWVEREVETGFDAESIRKLQNRSDWLMLIPLRLDNAIMRTAEAWAADIRRMRYIGNFSQWKDNAIYQIQFHRLLRDLRRHQ